MEVDKELRDQFFEHHRFYSNRGIQYFGAIFLLNSLAISGLKDLFEKNELIGVLSLVCCILVCISYHLLNWNDMRTDSNMKKLNKLLGENKVNEATNPFENTFNWIRCGVVVQIIPYFIIQYNYGYSKHGLIAMVFLTFLIISISEYTRHNFQKSLVNE